MSFKKSWSVSQYVLRSEIMGTFEEQNLKNTQEHAIECKKISFYDIWQIKYISDITLGDKNDKKKT